MLVTGRQSSAYGNFLTAFRLYEGFEVSGLFGFAAFQWRSRSFVSFTATDVVRDFREPEWTLNRRYKESFVVG